MVKRSALVNDHYTNPKEYPCKLPVTRSVLRRGIGARAP